jgi:Plavaka transposase
MYSLIDSITEEGAVWKCMQTVVPELLLITAPEWKKVSYQVWYRDPDQVIVNILANLEFAEGFDPHHTCIWMELDSDSGQILCLEILHGGMQ